MYKRITKDEYEIQGCYSQGWECVTTEETLKEAKTQLKCYNDNENYPHRIIKKRVKLILTLKQQLINALNIPETNFQNHCSDLLILYNTKIDNWLKANYEFYPNVKVKTANVEGHEWYTKQFFDIPFAFEYGRA